MPLFLKPPDSLRTDPLRQAACESGTLTYSHGVAIVATAALFDPGQDAFVLDAALRVTGITEIRVANTVNTISEYATKNLSRGRPRNL